MNGSLTFSYNLEFILESTIFRRWNLWNINILQFIILFLFSWELEIRKIENSFAANGIQCRLLLRRKLAG